MTKVYGRLLTLTLIASLLLWLGWPPLPFSIFLFFALVPLLHIGTLVEKFNLRPSVHIAYIYLALFMWNLSTTYWIYNTTIGGGILIHLINPLLFCLPFIIHRIAKKRLSKTFGYIVFISSWVSIEYFHHNWQLAYPFLTLGNGFSMYPQVVQFYEYTGVLGGSLWVLLVNVAIFECFQKFTVVDKINQRAKKLKLIGSTVALFLIPLIISISIFISYEEKSRPVEVVVVHPNTDCRNDKYLTNVDSLVERYISYSIENIGPETDYILWPETAITNARWIEEINTSKLLQSIKAELLVRHDKTKLITGAVLFELYKSRFSDDAPENVPNLRYNPEEKFWFYTYNAAFQLSNGDLTLPMRTKNKLVPVEETIPYAKQLLFLRKIVRSLGGYTFATRRINNNVFQSENGIGTTTLICYESIFGDLTAEYVRDGAQLLFVILNEGWYKNIRGASQFMYYSSLRAIENRRSIARSSNDGISCFINQKGEISQITTEFAPKAIKGTLNANRKKTFYTKFGDYLGFISTLLLSLLMIGVIFSAVLKKQYSHFLINTLFI